MTRTGIIALLIIIGTLFIIGVVGFIFAKVRLSSNVTTSIQKEAVEVTPRPTGQENVASPAAVISPKEATPSAQRVKGTIIVK